MLINWNFLSLFTKLIKFLTSLVTRSIAYTIIKALSVQYCYFTPLIGFKEKREVGVSFTVQNEETFYLVMIGIMGMKHCLCVSMHILPFIRRIQVNRKEPNNPTYFIIFFFLSWNDWWTVWPIFENRFISLLIWFVSVVWLLCKTGCFTSPLSSPSITFNLQPKKEAIIIESQEL